jgi:hypothetical protein
MCATCFQCTIYFPNGPGRSGGIATDYGLDGPGVESSWGENFPPVQTGPAGPLNLLYNGYWVFLEGKVRPGRGADRSPPASAVAMKE